MRKDACVAAAKKDKAKSVRIITTVPFQFKYSIKVNACIRKYVMRLYFSYKTANLTVSIQSEAGELICMPCDVSMVNVQDIYSIPNLHYFELNTSVNKNFTVYMGGSSFPVRSVLTTGPLPPVVPPLPPVVPPDNLSDGWPRIYFTVFFALTFVCVWIYLRSPRRKKRLDYSIKASVFKPDNEIDRETLKF